MRTHIYAGGTIPTVPGAVVTRAPCYGPQWISPGPLISCLLMSCWSLTKSMACWYTKHGMLIAHTHTLQYKAWHADSTAPCCVTYCSTKRNTLRFRNSTKRIPCRYNCNTNCNKHLNAHCNTNCNIFSPWTITKSTRYWQHRSAL